VLYTRKHWAGTALIKKIIMVATSLKDRLWWRPKRGNQQPMNNHKSQGQVNGEGR